MDSGLRGPRRFLVSLLALAIGRSFENAITPRQDVMGEIAEETPKISFHAAVSLFFFGN